MNRYPKYLAASLLACTAQVTLAAGSPGVERQTEGFLNALAAGGGKPLEQLSSADARAALVGLQAGTSLQSLKVDITEKTINAASHDIKLTVVRPAGAGGTLPVFMFFHGGGWVLGDFPTHERFVRDLVVGSWDSYTTDFNERNEVYASPLLATTEQLKGLPPALVQTAEKDVLRDEGEAYARRLDAAGVDVTAVRYNGMIHDVGLLNALSEVSSTRSALLQASEELKKHLK